MVICVPAEGKCVDRHFGDKVFSSIKEVPLVYRAIREEQDDAIVVPVVADYFMRVGKS